MPSKLTVPRGRLDQPQHRSAQGASCRSRTPRPGRSRAARRRRGRRRRPPCTCADVRSKTTPIVIGKCTSRPRTESRRRRRQVRLRRGVGRPAPDAAHRRVGRERVVASQRPAAGLVQRRRTRVHGSMRFAQRGANAQPLRPRQGVGRRARDRVQRRPARRVQPRAPTRAARRCTGAAARRTARGGRPTRRSGPQYMTCTASHSPATTPRSWVIITSAVPAVARPARVSSSRICAWIVTSSAVVGSSAISSRGRQASAIAISARWRMPPESWCGYSLSRGPGRGMPTGAAARRPRSRASSPLTPGCRSSTSVTCCRSVTTGLSERHRVLEDHRDVPAADVAHLVLGQREQVVAVEADRPATSTPRVGSRPMIASEVTLLPQPDSPTRPTVSPAVDVEATRRRRRATSRRPVRRERDRRGRGPRAARARLGERPGAHRRLTSPVLRVEGLAQRLAEQGEAERGEHDRHAGEERQVRRGRTGTAACRRASGPTPARRVGAAEAEEGQAGRVDDRGRQRQRPLHDHRRRPSSAARARARSRRSARRRATRAAST